MHQLYLGTQALFLYLLRGTRDGFIRIPAEEMQMMDNILRDLRPQVDRKLFERRPESIFNVHGFKDCFRVFYFPLLQIKFWVNIRVVDLDPVNQKIRFNVILKWLLYEPNFYKYFET